MVLFLAAFLANANPIPSFGHGWQGEPDNVPPPPPENPYVPVVGVNFIPLPVAFGLHDHPVDMRREPVRIPERAPEPTPWQLKSSIGEPGELVPIEDLEDPSVVLE